MNADAFIFSGIIMRNRYDVNLKRRKEADRISLNGGQPEA